MNPKDRIKEYLDKKAEIDELFAVTYAKKQKIEAELARVREREEAKRKAIEAKKDMLKFYQSKIKFFGLEIKGNGIIIRPLESVTQFYLEAKAMHHCVFSCKYFAKPESLILSARDSKGNRLETVEINLNTMGIVQSRAVNNGKTKKHKEIINLIKKNVNLIKQRVA